MIKAQSEKSTNVKKRQRERRGRQRERDRGRTRAMGEQRRRDIRTDTVQQTESYGDIWRILEAVMNRFGFFYRSARVSLMAKQGLVNTFL